MNNICIMDNCGICRIIGLLCSCDSKNSCSLFKEYNKFCSKSIDRTFLSSLGFSYKDYSISMMFIDDDVDLRVLTNDCKKEEILVVKLNEVTNLLTVFINETCKEDKIVSDICMSYITNSFRRV